MINELTRIARTAGEKILDIYNHASDFEIEKKGDDSPLPLADRVSHAYIVEEFPKKEGIFLMKREKNGIVFGVWIPWMEPKSLLNAMANSR